MNTPMTLVGLTVCLAISGQAVAQAAGNPAMPALLNQSPALAAPHSLRVASPAYGQGGAIPLANSSYGASLSPPLRISGAPGRTRTFAIVMEDADAQHDGAPILHWMAYDAPASLPGGLPAGESITAPVGLRQGRNIAGQYAYRGPHPSPSSGAHHYHLEVFALDAPIPEAQDRNTLAEAMAGHVLAQGELVGVFAAPKPATP